jgi:Holliday junction resolvase RusA-like endonuclease
MDGALSVSVSFVLPKPKTTKRKTPWVRPDIDGLCKGLLDVGNGILWHDDGQVVKLQLEKLYPDDGEGPRVIIEVEEV